MTPDQRSAAPRTKPVTPSKLVRTSRLALAAAVVLCAALATPQAWAKDLMVRYDQSQLIRLPRPASEVIIGNPSIADVTIQGGDMLVVTGKTFGITNIIALDNQRNVIQDQRVIVERDDSRMVSLFRGSVRESYTCTPSCSPTITIGDETTFFENVSKHATSKAAISMGNGAALAGQQGR
jgi:Flp pilus assembly secretin CpaC